ncbi:MAG: DUF805 domain-containing protein [Rickettsiales bacterium]|nr:DUF805 domain-containing protein [Rickettsiales bacterium]
MPKKIAKPAVKTAPKVRFVGFAEAMRNFVERAFDFRGVSTRAEYWWPFLVVAVVSLGIDYLPMNDGWLTLAVYLLVFVPGLSIGVRRLHDIGWSGFWAYAVTVGELGMLGFIRLVEHKLETVGGISQSFAFSYLAYLALFMAATAFLLVLHVLPTKLENNKYRKQ